MREPRKGFSSDNVAWTAAEGNSGEPFTSQNCSFSKLWTENVRKDYAALEQEAGNLGTGVIEDLGLVGEGQGERRQGEEFVSMAVRGKYEVGNHYISCLKSQSSLISLSPRFLSKMRKLVSGF